MNINKIIAHAACNSGLVPSFNIPEIPADIQAHARQLLTEEIIPLINSDRTLDANIIAKDFQPTLHQLYIQANVNIDFMPMRIDAVFDKGSRIPYTYLYREEFESLDYRFDPFVYAIETKDDGILLLFRNNLPKICVIPVPLRVDGDNITGQPKFSQYLIDILAQRLAINWGLSTVQAMTAAAQLSYNLLVKNVNSKIRPVNPRMLIRDVLRRGEARNWNIQGFV